MALSSFLSSLCVRFIVVTALSLKQTSNHFVAYNDHSIMHRYQLWFGHQIIYLFSLHINRLLLYLLYFFVSIASNQFSLRLIDSLTEWGIYSCSMITVPITFEHFKFLRIPVIAPLSYLWRNNVYIQYYLDHVLIFRMKGIITPL